MVMVTNPSVGCLKMDYNLYDLVRACLGISGMNGNEGYWGGGISIISQNFPKSPLILFKDSFAMVGRWLSSCTFPSKSAETAPNMQN
jgi:hypothetical protein